MTNHSNGSKKILIVEDEPVIERMCQRILSNEGFEADVAPNGKVAQDMSLQKQYDLFLVDIKMPIVDGRVFYTWLKQSRPESARGVIFTSGDTISSDTREFLEKSRQPFLSKPFDANTLKTVVRKLVNSRTTGYNI